MGPCRAACPRVAEGRELESKLQLIMMGSEGGFCCAGTVKVDEAPEGAMNTQMNDGPQSFNTYQDALAGTSAQLP